MSNIKFSRLLIVISLLLLTLFNLIILVKPGARLFFRSYQIDSNDIVQADDSFEYDLKLNENFYDSDTLLLVEQGKILRYLQPDQMLSDAPGEFEIERVTRDHFLITFIPLDTLSVESQGKLAVIVRPHFISSPLMLFTFIFFAVLLANVILPIFLDQKKRSVFLLAEKRTFFDLVKHQVLPKPSSKSHRLFFLTSLRQIVFAALAYVFLEWLFLVTMPSFMIPLSIWKKVRIPIISWGMIAYPLLAAFFGLVLAHVLLRRWVPRFYQFAYPVPAALLLTCLILLLLDNFTYTVFGLGIVNASPYLRPFYALFFIETFLFVNRWLRANIMKQPDQQKRRSFVGTGLLLATLLLPLFTAVLSINPIYDSHQETTASNKLPNIILLGNDGLNAANMSVYGYSNQTTPFMETLARTSLIGLNNFTNAAHSAGSDTSMLTGKLPINTGVLYPPDALTGQDMYQHLPGVLKQLGYRTVSLGVRHYMDVNVLNFQNAFDAVNCVEKPVNMLSQTGYRYGFGSEIMFLKTIRERVTDRLLHIFFIKDMQNVFAEVTRDMPSTHLSDDERYACLYEELASAQTSGQPLFVHVHNISTHGPQFTPEITKFSEGQSQDGAWMTAFYDDAILSYDDRVRQLVEYMQTLGEFENTILVLYTDHGAKWKTTGRIPLIIHFPESEYAGEISENTQNLDIAPTLLDYLNVDQPGWMDGSSMLGPLESDRLIFSFAADPATIDPETGALKMSDLVPPFFQFAEVYVIQCQKVFDINLKNLSMREYVVSNYVGACTSEMPDPPEIIWDELAQLFVESGYELPEDW